MKRGIGHYDSQHSQHSQQSFFQAPSKRQLSHGGSLRQLRAGRGTRPLSTKEPLHVVFKVDKSRLRFKSLRATQNFSLIHKIIKRYSWMFAVKIEQLSIQKDHLHILIRAPRRCRYHYFFRVVAGQIAQRFEQEGLLQTTSVTDTPIGATRTPAGSVQNGTSLWKFRPFSRVVRGFRALKIVRDYIQLNEQEARGKIRYQKKRLRGLSSSDWRILWRS